MRYFVDPTRRLVRTEDSPMVTFRYPWREVTSQDFDAFRKETETLYNTPKKRAELKQLRLPAGL